MDKKTLFLQQAWQLFNRVGFHATSIEELREQLGITKKTLYRYFESKEQLILEVLHYRDDVFLQQMKQALSTHRRQTAILAYLDFIEHWVQQTDFCGCSFINASAEYSQHESEQHQIAKTHKAHVKALLAKHDIAEPQLTQIFLLGEGLIVQNQVSGYQARDFEVARQMMDALRS